MPNPTAGEHRKAWFGSGFLRYEQDLADGLTAYAGLGHSERPTTGSCSPDHGPAGAVNAFAGIQPERTTQLRRRPAQLRDRACRPVRPTPGRSRTTSWSPPRQRAYGEQANDARIAGAEAGLEVSLAQQWTLGGTLAYAWGENRDQQRPLPQMPPLEARLSANRSAS